MEESRVTGYADLLAYLSVFSSDIPFLVSSRTLYPCFALIRIFALINSTQSCLLLLSPSIMSLDGLASSLSGVDLNDDESVITLKQELHHFATALATSVEERSVYVGAHNSGL